MASVKKTVWSTKSIAGVNRLLPSTVESRKAIYQQVGTNKRKFLEYMYEGKHFDSIAEEVNRVVPGASKSEIVDITMKFIEGMNTGSATYPQLKNILRQAVMYNAEVGVLRKKLEPALSLGFSYGGTELPDYYRPEEYVPGQKATTISRRSSTVKALSKYLFEDEGYKKELYLTLERENGTFEDISYEEGAKMLGKLLGQPGTVSPFSYSKGIIESARERDDITQGKITPGRRAQLNVERYSYSEQALFKWRQLCDYAKSLPPRDLGISGRTKKLYTRKSYVDVIANLLDDLNDSVPLTTEIALGILEETYTSSKVTDIYLMWLEFYDGTLNEDSEKGYKDLIHDIRSAFSDRNIVKEEMQFKEMINALIGNAEFEIEQLVREGKVESQQNSAMNKKRK